MKTILHGASSSERRPDMTELSIEIQKARAQLRKKLFCFRFYYMMADVIDLAVLSLTYAMLIVLYLVAMLLLILRWILLMLELYDIAEPLNGIDGYYGWCMEQVEEKLDNSTSKIDGVYSDFTAIIRASTTMLHPNSSWVFRAVDYSTVISKIEFVVEDRKEIGAALAALLLFVLRAITFTA